MQTYTLLTLAASVQAFPALQEMRNAPPHIIRDAAELTERTLAKRSLAQRQEDALGQSAAETNCGPTPCLNFDPVDQLVSVTGQHVYASPAAGDIRGPCPGLNAAANHGYLPRNGIASIEQTVAGLGAAYNLGPIVTAALAAYAVAIDGNILEGVWSIGGPLPQDLLLGDLIGTGQGLSYSHNNYEGDASIGRNDAYTNNGDAHSLNITKFENVYKTGGNDLSEDGRAQRFTIDKFRQSFEAVQQESIENNPYYFTGAFSTVVVVPAAYNFVINLMSNHSAEEPSGYLDGYNFKQFFGVSGKPGSFKWNPGQERIPEDWYRRPSTNPYEAQQVVGDVALGYLAYPKTLRFGGNTGKVNTFTGIDVGNLTGGVFNAATLFEGNNFQCFAFQLVQQGLPAFLKGPLSDLNKALSFLSPILAPLLAGLNCPQLGALDQGLFNSFPGYDYSPTGPATNYKK